MLVFVLKEKVKPFQALAVIVAFIGALFIIKPQSISQACQALWECSEDSEQVWRTQGQKIKSERRKRPVYSILFLGIFVCCDIAVFDS